jgi:hypothetical protein
MEDYGGWESLRKAQFTSRDACRSPSFSLAVSKLDDFLFHFVSKREHGP